MHTYIDTYIILFVNIKDCFLEIIRELKPPHFHNACANANDDNEVSLL